MNRKFLVMVATVCGLVAIVALLLLSYETFQTVNAKGEKTSEGLKAVESLVGAFSMLFAFVAAGFCGLVFLGKTEMMGLSEERHLAISFLGWKLLALFSLANLIAGGTLRADGLGIGFWLTFLASLVGTFAVFLTFNQALAKKIADKAKDMNKEDENTGAGDAATGGDTPAS